MTGKLGCTLQQVIGNVITRIDPVVTMNPLVDAGRYAGEQKVETLDNQLGQVIYVEPVSNFQYFDYVTVIEVN